MKIYFTGAHSTGKSTLTKYISEKYNLSMIFEIARVILSEQELQLETLRHNLDTVDSYQKNVFERQLMEEKKYLSFVSDRSVLDALAYTAQHSRIFHELIRAPELIPYIESLKAPDVKIFFIRPSKATLKNDGVRENVVWDGIIAIDAMVKMLLEMYNLKYFQISCESMQERVKLVDSILHGLTFLNPSLTKS